MKIESFININSSKKKYKNTENEENRASIQGNTLSSN
jgi:hypothetical protein